MKSASTRLASMVKEVALRACGTQFLFVLLALSCSVAMAQDHSLHNVRRPEGYVPDQETAIKIAVAVWEPIYGKAAIAKQSPYNARLNNGVWVVTGSLPGRMLGGVALAEISKEHGTILRVTHGR